MNEKHREIFRVRMVMSKLPTGSAVTMGSREPHFNAWPHAASYAAPWADMFDAE